MLTTIPNLAPPLNPTLDSLLDILFSFHLPLPLELVKDGSNIYFMPRMPLDFGGSPSTTNNE